MNAPMATEIPTESVAAGYDNSSTSWRGSLGYRSPSGGASGGDGGGRIEPGAPVSAAAETSSSSWSPSSAASGRQPG